MAKKNPFSTPAPAKSQIKEELAAQLADEPRLVRINFDVTQEMRNRFKARCAAEGKNMRDVMTELVKAYLQGD